MKHAVVMAAGEGSRLRPLTEEWPKPILPIDGRAVIATLLRELAAAGLERVVVVTGHLAEQVEALVGDGSGFGIEVGFARQPGVLGSADAVQRGIAAGAEPPFLVAAADTVFEPGDLARFAAAAEQAAGGLAVRRAPPPDPPHRWGTRVEDGRVVAVLDRERTSDVSGAPLWSVGAELVRYLDGLSGPPYELADAYERAVADGVVVLGFEIGRTRDLTHPADLVRENFPYLGS
jgi:UDP-N-acetylglucosamine diphosphorylase / glucose-1-phosphate thymidylyltransferase / UDP-N-acetylgalactosamine diphosphorylase / glucosamine-1-phosphate N-acetyltransferase / galactosamine-1-phosphate N-acetyltransferase